MFAVAVSKVLGVSLLNSVMKSVYRCFATEPDTETTSIKKNALYSFMHFYQFGVLKAAFVIGLLADLAKDLSVFNIDIMNHYIQNVGFDLRKDEPMKLKEFIEQIEEQLKLSETMPEGIAKRLLYFMEDLQNVRNNKKLSFYEMARAKIEPLVNWLKGNKRVRGELNSGPIQPSWKELCESGGLTEVEPKAIERDKLRKIGVTPRLKHVVKRNYFRGRAADIG